MIATLVMCGKYISYYPGRHNGAKGCRGPTATATAATGTPFATADSGLYFDENR